jgi:hypothetical protein
VNSLMDSTAIGWYIMMGSLSLCADASPDVSVVWDRTLHIIDGRDTARMRHRRKSKLCSLWKRTYCCGDCGLVKDRDENSAVNISQRFLARPGSRT